MKRTKPARWQKPGDQVRTAADRRALMAWAISTPNTDVDCARCGGAMVIMPATKTSPRGYAICLAGCSGELAGRAAR